MIWLNKLVRNRLLIPYYLEAGYYLLLAKCLIILLPFPLWKKYCGYFQCETLKQSTKPIQTELTRLTKAITTMARYVPWSSKCLDQAYAAQCMLKRRGLANTLYFGVLKNEQKCWLAHAWLRCGDYWVIGFQALTTYTVVGCYAWIN